MHEHINLLQGDCLQTMKTLADNSVDAIVSDPPYGISFMAKKWDYDVPSVEVWKEAMRVLKPGGHALIACGTRTQHRMVVNIEDAGFEIRDVVSWIYGCLSDDTEILIEGQWEPYHKAIDKGHALTYNIETDSFQWEQIQELVTYDYNDTAYRIHSDNTDQIVSRNHRCIVERSGGKAFAYAETLECEEGVPVLEDLPRLLEALPVPHKGASDKKQVVQGLPQEKHGAMGQRKETGKAGVCSLQSDVSPHRAEQEQAKESLQQGVQRDSAGCGVAETRAQRSRSMDGEVQGGASPKDDGGDQSSLEGRSDLLQQERELQTDQICEMSGSVPRDVSEGWVCNGASFDSSASDGANVDTDGSSSPREPRSSGQQDRESGVVRKQSGPQTVRASRHASTDLAVVEPIHYEGIVWCVRVPSGAFVARRNGKVFVTGNSGFPKSLNIGKAIDKNGGNGHLANEIAQQLKNARTGRGLSQKKADDLFCGGTTNYSWYEGRPAGQRIPNEETFKKIALEWSELKSLQEKVAEAEREVVGSKTTKSFEHHKGSMMSKETTENFDTSTKEINITAPATDAAKQWDGFGTALKPACEFFTLCRKPLSEKTIAANVLKWGTGGINIDGCRVGTDDGKNRARPPRTPNSILGGGKGASVTASAHNPTGRFPANLIHDGSQEVLDLFPATKSGGKSGGDKKAEPSKGSPFSEGWNHGATHGDKGSAARFYYCAKASKKDRNEGCDHLEAKRNNWGDKSTFQETKPEDQKPKKNNHPTVKPTALMQYLCRLITPPGGTVLDPYMGSGSTGKAAIKGGFGFIGCELDPEYFEIAKTRIEFEDLI